MSISQITDDLFVGGRLRATDVGLLDGLGITCVLNVGWPDEPDPQEIQNNFCYQDETILDDGKPKPAEWFQSGIDFYNAREPGEKVLVHCGHGINRSPAMVYAILRSQGMGEQDALALLRKQRPQTATGATGDWFFVYTKSYEEGLK